MQNEEFIQLIMTNTIGESILVETLKSAAYFVSKSGNVQSIKHPVLMGKYHESRSCYYFVQGTGLDVLIQRFHLAYDAENLRSTFNYCLRHS